MLTTIYIIICLGLLGKIQVLSRRVLLYASNMLWWPNYTNLKVKDRFLDNDSKTARVLHSALRFACRNFKLTLSNYNEEQKC